MAQTGAPEKDDLTAPQRAFLAAYAETGCVSRACKAADVGRRSHYRWLAESEAYKAAFAEADDVATEALEAEARRRALDGVRRHKFDRGRPIMVPCRPGDPDGRCVEQAEDGSEVWAKPYVEHEYSDTLLIFLLKGKRPEVYRDRVEAKHSGAVDLNHTGGVRVYLPDNRRQPGGEAGA